MTIPTDDKIEIQELCARIYLAIDGNDAAGFAAGFAADGTFVAPYGEFTGTDAVRSFMEDHIAAGKEDGVRHFITNQVIDPQADGARYRFYILKMNIATGPVAIASAAGDAVVVKTPEGWRFQRFQLMIDPAMFGSEEPALRGRNKN